MGKKYISPSEMVEKLKVWMGVVVAAAVVACVAMGIITSDATSRAERTALELEEVQTSLLALEGRLDDTEALEDEVESLEASVSEYEAVIAAKDAEILSLIEELEDAEESIAALEASRSSTASNSSAVGSSGGSSYSGSSAQTATVYVTNTGSKYHKNGCQYLSQSKNAISLNNAKAAGYSACSRCY